MSEAAPRWAARLVEILHRRGRWLIVGLLVVTLGIGAFASTIKVDNSLKVWFVEGDPALIAYDHYKDVFGNDEIIIVAATAPADAKDGIYDAAYLTRVRAASQALEKLPRVRQVQSLAVSLHATNEQDDIVVGPLLPEHGDITADDVAAVKRRVAADPSFQGVIVGHASGAKADKVSLILVEPKSSPDYELTRKEIIDQVNAIVNTELKKDGGGSHLGGIGVVYEGLNQASLQDSGVFITLSYLILLAGLWFIFRRIAWVLIGAAIVSVAVAATLGLAGLFGRDMNMVTAIVPTMIMTIGILDMVHLVDAYDEGVAGGIPRARILGTTVAMVVVPCIVNSATDVVGFASFVFAPVGAIRDLGWLVSAGLIILVIAVLIIGIPALGRYGGRKGGITTEQIEKSWVTRGVLAMSRFAVRNKLAVLAVTVLLAGLSVLGMTRLQVDTYTIGFLPHDHVVRADHEAIEASFGQYVPLEFTAKVTRPDARITDPEALSRVDAIEREFEKNDAVGRTTGVVDIVKQVHRVYMDDEAAYSVPAKREAVTQLLDTTYAQTADAEDTLNALLDDRQEPRMTHMTSRSGLPSANTIAQTLRELQAAADKVDGDVVEVAPAGYLPLYVRITQNITDAQISSAGSAFLLVALIMMLLLRSVKLGLLAMVPNLLPAVMTLGVMGAVGIPLDLATVLIAGIVIGISVNDTSHIMFRFQQELSVTPGDPHGALERMMRGTGRAVVMGSLTLIAGFAVLLGASVQSVFYFGLLTTMTTIAALLADLIITPALVMLVTRPRADRTAVP
jgi:predicted RND superfamily exporter protein